MVIKGWGCISLQDKNLSGSQQVSFLFLVYIGLYSHTSVNEGAVFVASAGVAWMGLYWIVSSRLVLFCMVMCLPQM